jgi:hypothetical protein
MRPRMLPLFSFLDDGGANDAANVGTDVVDADGRRLMRVLALPSVRD